MLPLLYSCNRCSLTPSEFYLQTNFTSTSSIHQLVFDMVLTAFELKTVAKNNLAKPILLGRIPKPSTPCIYDESQAPKAKYKI